MRIQQERVINGEGLQDVMMIYAPLVSPGCADSYHCAAHGDGPFTCCKCGAMFRLATQTDRRAYAANLGL